VRTVDVRRLRWLAAVIAELDDDAFRNGVIDRARLLLQLRIVQALTVLEVPAAVELLDVMIARTDGCRTRPDRDDAIVDCAAQLQFRALAEVLRDQLTRS